MGVGANLNNPTSNIAATYDGSSWTAANPYPVSIAGCWGAEFKQQLFGLVVRVLLEDQHLIQQQQTNLMVQILVQVEHCQLLEQT